MSGVVGYVLRNSTPSRFRISAIASTTFMVAPFGEGGSAPLSTPLRTRGAVHSCPRLDAFGVCAGRAWPRPSSTPPASSRGGHCRPRLDAFGVRAAGAWPRPPSPPPASPRGGHGRRRLDAFGGCAGRAWPPFFGSPAYSRGGHSAHVSTPPASRGACRSAAR